MANLLTAIKEAEEKRIALGHFNISDIAGLKEIVSAIKLFNEENRISMPVLIGVSSGEEKYLGINNVVSLINNLRNDGLQVFLNADHVRDLDRLEKVARAGYDSATFDLSKLSIEENIKITKEAVRISKSINPNFVLEGELGYIGEPSGLLDKIPEGAAVIGDLMTTPEEAKKFVEETGVDMLAPAVGNIHGMLKNMPNPALDLERVRLIKEATNIPLVLHGGSGITDADFIGSINNGISIVHINTEIRVAWRQGVEIALRNDKDEVSPYKILPFAEEEIKKVVYQRVKLFGKK